jgi:hypothetical protein
MLKSIRYGLLICLFAYALAGCDLLSDQTDEANKINGETNTLIDKYNAATSTRTKLFNDLLGENMKGVSDIKAYQEKNSAEFDELQKSIESQIKLSKEIVDKYSPILKLKVSDKYKEYAQANLKVHEKRVEGNQMMQDFVKSFLATDDIDKVNAMIDENNKKTDEFNKAMDELEKKSDQILKENPDEFVAK